MRDVLLVAIRSDLLRVARGSGLPKNVGPRKYVYRDRGRFGVVKVCAEAGGYEYREDGTATPVLGWDDAIRAYGLTPHSDTRTVSDRELVDDLRRVAMMNDQGPDGLPPVEVYKNLGRWSWMTVLRRFGGEERSWYRVGEYTKLTPVDRARRGSVTPERLLSDYRDLADLQGVEPGDVGPTRRQFAAYVSYSGSCARYHFRAWSSFVEEAGFQPHESPIGREAA